MCMAMVPAEVSLAFSRQEDILVCWKEYGRLPDKLTGKDSVHRALSWHTVEINVNQYNFTWVHGWQDEEVEPTSSDLRCIVILRLTLKKVECQ